MQPGSIFGSKRQRKEKESKKEPGIERYTVAFHHPLVRTDQSGVSVCEDETGVQACQGRLCGSKVVCCLIR